MPFVQNQDPYLEYWDRTNYLSEAGDDNIQFNINDNLINNINIILNRLEDGIINNDNNLIYYNNLYDDNLYNDNIDLIIRTIFNNNNEYFNEPNELIGNLQEQNPIQLVPIELNELEQIVSIGDCCSICLNQFANQIDNGENEHSNMCRIGCGHHYHIGCIGNWLNTHNTCPLCRTIL